MKKKGFFEIVFCCSLLAGCSWVQRGLSFDIAVPYGSDGLVFSSYLDDTEHISYKPSADCYDAFFSNEYQAIVYDLNKGISLIQDHNAPFRLARVVCYGNAFLVGRSKTEGEEPGLYSNIVSWDCGYSRYSSHSYENCGIQNNIFEWVFGEKYIDGYFDSAKDEYQALLSEKYNSKDIDYALLPEPYASRLISEDANYAIMGNLTSLFKSKTAEEGITDNGYAHFPQTGLFVSSSWEDKADSSLTELHKNFFVSYDNMAADLERNNASRVAQYLEKALNDGKIDLKDTFGGDYDTLAKCLDGGSSPQGVNACGFCSYATDLEAFYKKTEQAGLFLVGGSIDKTSYSTFYK